MCYINFQAATEFSYFSASCLSDKILEMVVIQREIILFNFIIIVLICDVCKCIISQNYII